MQQRILKPILVEPYVNNDVRSNIEWLRRIEVLEAVLELHHKRALLFSKQYFENAWTFDIYVRGGGQLLLGGVIDENGHVKPLPTAAAWSFCLALGCTPTDLRATSSKPPDMTFFLDNNEAFLVSLRPLQPRLQRRLPQPALPQPQGGPDAGRGAAAAGLPRLRH